MRPSTLGRGQPATSSVPRCFNAVFTLFSRCFNAVSTLFQRCFHAVSTLFQRCFHAVSTLFLRCFNAVSTLFSRCVFNDVFTLFQRCFYAVSTLFSRRFNDIFTLFPSRCTQPRRISAIGVAERVASEKAEGIGATVGYQVRIVTAFNEISRHLTAFYANCERTSPPIPVPVPVPDPVGEACWG